MITELEFKSLAAQGYNRIPLMVEAFADLETPLSLYLKLAHAQDGGKHSFLLESVVGGERFGRYSFIGLPARTLLRASGFGTDAKTEVVTDGVVVETASGNPLDFIAEYQKRFKVALRPGLPRFCGGLAGYFGYDAVRYIEKKLEASCPPDTLGCPDILLLQCEELAVIDNLSGKLYLIVYADPAQPEAYARAKQRLRALKEQLKYSVSAPQVKASESHPAQRSFAKPDYLAAVQKAKDLIAAGDFMQVQVGQRIHKRYTESPLSLYRALRSLNPSPYMYYYHFGDFQVVGASPEILVRQEHTEEGTKVTIRPLAGTRPRGATPEKDKAAELELINDPKERAEHVMLIDLERNDLGRICRPGSVEINELMTVASYATVHHIESNVRGRLRDGLTPADVFRALFPGGTITGCPKVRCMQIIRELESSPRRAYTGSLGYINRDGSMDTNILIRTFMQEGNRLRFRAGAGIVIDSQPERELQETRHKARGLLRALGLE